MGKDTPHSVFIVERSECELPMEWVDITHQITVQGYDTLVHKSDILAKVCCGGSFRWVRTLRNDGTAYMTIEKRRLAFNSPY